MAKKSFVGFGFGPIQTGLMLYEAQQSGNFDSFTIAEIDQSLVDAVRANDDAVVINIAGNDATVKATISNVKLYNPAVAADRAALCSAIARADEMATAIPSVKFYTSGGANAIAALLSENINPAKQQILYASENNNFAASILESEIVRRSEPSRCASFQILDTVIGKMSGVVTGAATIKELGLAPLTPSLDRAILVEEFNKILVSRVRLPEYRRGITVFEEKDDLLPFEEAKLFGHNAIHSLLGYLAFQRGHTVMSRIRADQELMALGRKAFVEESGGALLAKYASLHDPLFTQAGYAAYADDLITRMTNPYLHDSVGRICRDPLRKLGLHDRLFGTMCEALKRDITPTTLASGAAAALRYYVMQEKGLTDLPTITADEARGILRDEIWKNETLDSYAYRCIELVQHVLLTS